MPALGRALRQAQFPSKRRAYARGPGLRAIRDLLLVSIDLSEFRFD
jgi:hypothetical protein